MKHYLKHSLELLIPVLLLSFYPNVYSTPAVEEFIDTLSDTNTNDDAALKLSTPSPSGDTLTTEPPQPPEQRGHWGTPVSYNHNAHASGEKTNSSAEAAVKESNSGDNNNIHDLEVQHVPFIPTPSKQKNTISTDGGKNKSQAPTEQTEESRLREDPPTIDIASTNRPTSTIGGEKPTASRISHIPPEGFTLTAHCKTNPQDRQSYFTTAADDPQGPNDELLIPFLECGAVGSTTQGIPLHRAYFRHFPKSAHPAEFTPAQESHLLICLNQVEMAVSGGDDDGEKTRVFERGSVILVEDVMGSGHKLYSSDGDVSVLMLTLPPLKSHHYGVGKNEDSGSSVAGIGRRVGGGVMSLFGRYRQKKTHSDCQMEHDPAYSALGLQSQSDAEDDDLSIVRSIAKNAPTKRRVILTSIGLSLSTITSFFLSKVAPLQLAVGIGGLCVVGGGTVGIVKGGEWLCDEAEDWMERQEPWIEEIATEEEALVEEEIKV